MLRLLCTAVNAPLDSTRPAKTPILAGVKATPGVVDPPSRLEPVAEAQLNLPRTKALLWDVYHWQTGTRNRPRGWVDQPSGSILQLYSVVYGGAARAFEAAGDTALAARADSVSRRVTAELNRGLAP